MAEIGSTLREARMRARIDISEVEARTKIRAKYLRALENEEWDLLPGTVYVKSFLKTYGEFLGLDSRLLVDEYKRRYERPSDHDPRPMAPLAARDRDRGQRDSGRGPGRGPARGPGGGFAISPWMAIVGVLVLIVVALAALGELFGGGSKTPTTGVGVSTQSHTSTTGKHHGKDGVTGTTTTTTTVTPKNVVLKIVPTGDVYICVERANGSKIIPGVTYTAGQTVPTAISHTLLVTFGNANATYTVDGRPHTLAPSSTPIGVKITSAGVASLKAGPSCA